MGFPVFFDTCTLYGELMCDLFLRMSEERLFVPYWSEGVLDELHRVLSERVGIQRADRRIRQMMSAFPDACIGGYDSLISEMQCAEEDRHVLAAASYSPADTLVTFNIKDFPRNSVDARGIEVKHPDDFLQDVVDLSPATVAKVCYSQLCAYRHYPQTPEEYADVLKKSGVPQSAAMIYPILSTLFLDA